ncbi:MAG: helix-turn-helix domain-containing protein [Candidatus Colwellbacteria bacterium]|nr:helix-turn-helix domain-containing protein [Candidatus Colwellbacteria bacterium]
MEEERKTIVEVLEELMEAKRIGIKELAEITDVPERYVEAIVVGKFEQLPAGPYVRGYLFKIAHALGADPNLLWRSYGRFVEATVTPKDDRLPSNRFALKRVSTRRVVIAAALLAILVFLGFRLDDILGRPSLNVYVPETSQTDVIAVTGDVSPGDTLTLNNEVVYPNEEGKFEKQVRLEPGLNSLEFRVKRFLGRETKVVKQVFYRPE